MLWELVHAVQDGRIEASHLDRALYGVDPGFMDPKIPVMYEVCVDEGRGSKRCNSLSKSVPLPKSSPARWKNIIPFFMSQPEGVLHNLFTERDDSPKAGSPGKKSPNSKRIRALSIEQKVDIAVLVKMPHQREESPASDSASSIRVVNSATHSLPFYFATASPTFQESVYDPIVPNEGLAGKSEDINAVGAISLSQAINHGMSTDHPLTLLFVTR
jgi:hypothetical protein